MRRFIFQVILFCSVLSFICSIPLWRFEYEARKCMSRHPYKRVNMIYNLKGANADLIIMGNSRAEDAYNDSVLSKVLQLKCVNIGWSGYPFDYQYNVMYKTYMKQNSIPKYVILEIGPWAFFDYFNPKYTVELLPYIDYPEFKFYYKLCPELTTADYWLLHKYAGMSDKISKQMQLIKGVTETKSKGFKHHYFKEKMKFEEDKDIINLFCLFLDECKAQGTDVFLICSPIHSNEGKPFFEMKRFWQLITKITKGKPIHILNYEDFYGNDTTYFQDPMHLNSFGRNDYSIKIGYDIDSIIKAKNYCPHNPFTFSEVTL